MGEHFPEKRSLEASENIKQKEKIGEKSLESKKDLQIKETLLSVLPETRTMLQNDIKSIRKLVDDLRERETSFSNFVSPENWLGFSTVIHSEGKTFSSGRLDTVEDIYEISNLRLLGLSKFERSIKTGRRFEEIKKDAVIGLFLSSPEGKLLEGIISGSKDQKLLEAEYYLAKARELRNKVVRGDELALDWYDKLKGTPLEKVAGKEKMSLGDRALRKGRDFANTMLGLDSLGAMVAGVGLGRLAGTLISKSDKLRNISMQGITAMNESKARFFIPGINVMKSGVGETGLKTFLRGGGNFLGEIAKGFTYTEIARTVGGEKMAHYISFPLMFIPGARAEFESSLQISLAKNPENFKKFAEWIVNKYKTPDKLNQAMENGLKETYNQSKSSVWIEEARKIYAEIKESSRVLFENFSKKGINKPSGSNLNNENITVSNPSGIRAGLTEKAGSIEGQNVKISSSEIQTNEKIQTGLEKPQTILGLQENIKSKVGEKLSIEPSLQELMDVGLPKDYVLALQELGIPNSQILKFKGWDLKTLHRELFIREKLSEFNKKAIEKNQTQITIEEAHVIFGSTTNLFFRSLNNRFWNDRGDNLQLANLLQSGVSKMLKSNPTQFRGDEMILDKFLHENGVFEKFQIGEAIPQEVLDKLIGERIILKAFSSSSDNIKDSFWNKPGTKYQLEIQNSNAYDITQFALFPNFGHELKKAGGVKTDQESVFLPGTGIIIKSVEQIKRSDGKPILRIIVIQAPK